MDIIDNIKHLVYPIFAKERIESAVLFGSFAKGTDQENSDIDIVIDSNGVLIGLDFYRILDELVQALDCQVDLFDKSEIVPDSPIQKRIRSEGVLLYERILESTVRDPDDRAGHPACRPDHGRGGQTTG